MGKKQARDLPSGHVVMADDEGVAATFGRMREMLGLAS